ncbi:peptidyl-prolyl cis-trans isomerase [Candidatus Omnitrophota bacterium]
MIRLVLIIAAMAIASFTIGCDQIEKLISPQAKVKPQASKVQAVMQEEPQGTKLAKVNSKVITYEEFEQNIKNLKALSEEVTVENFEQKKSLLDELINQELLYQEAKSRGISQRRELQDLTEGYLRNLAVRQLMIDITENVTVDAQEIETFYNQYKDQLSEPEQRRIREIVVSSEFRAKDIYIQLLNGEDFATIAKEKSIGESSTSAGDIGLIVRGARGEEHKKYDNIAFSLDKGSISSIFKGPKGYYIIKVEEVQDANVRSLQDTELWDQIKNTVLGLKQQQRLQDLIDKLKADASIEIIEDLLQ